MLMGILVALWCPTGKKKTGGNFFGVLDFLDNNTVVFPYKSEDSQKKKNSKATTIYSGRPAYHCGIHAHCVQSMSARPSLCSTKFSGNESYLGRRVHACYFKSYDGCSLGEGSKNTGYNIVWK